MTPGTPPANPAASVTVSRRRRLSAVWIAPVLAAVAVGYLVYDSLRSRGPLITLRFHDAEGIVPGKSPLKVEGVRVGTVRDVEIDLATGVVSLTGRLDASARDLAVEGSRFWIQNPVIGPGGINSLDTLISGPYVACIPGSGAERLEFEGLAERPPVPDSRPGLRVTLRAEVVRQLRAGSPVLYRGVRVGLVDAIRIGQPGEPVSVDLFIEDEHAGLVRSDSLFWEVAGMRVEYREGEGLVVDTQALDAMLGGAVAFADPGGGQGERVADGASFAMGWHPWLDAGPRTGDGAPRQVLDDLASVLHRAESSGLIDSVVGAMDELARASVEANRAIGSAERLVESDGRLDRTLADVTVMADGLRVASDGVTAALREIEERQMLRDADRVITQIEPAVIELRQTMATLRGTIEEIDGLVQENGAPLSEALRALRKASIELDALLEDLRANPSQILSDPPSRALPGRSP
jgi:ABC-type transporter Mla subunit MlaD